MTVLILVGECRERLRELPEGSAHCVVTSPPYYSLRDYRVPPAIWGGDPACGHAWGEWQEVHDKREYTVAGKSRTTDRCYGAPSRRFNGNHQKHTAGCFCGKCGAWRGCLGLEPDPDLYVEHLVEVFREVRRVLRDDGTVWLNLGDSHAGSWGNYGARAFRIADNQLALNADWDEGLLRASIEEILDAEGGDELVSLIGFPDDFLDDLLADPEDLAAGNIDDDEAPEPPDDPVSKPGDLWVLGNHRLLCGDATVLADVERVLDGGLADMVFCDPPYNVDYGNSAKDRIRAKAGRRGGRKILNDNLGDGFERFLYDACVNILTVTKGAVYMCMSSSELHTLQKAFKEAGGHWSTFVIWAKNTFTLGRADYQRQYEPILYGWKEGSDHYWCGARDQGDVWFVDKPRVNDLHPTMKPVALVERAIRNSSKSRDTVLDPFGGSGTTLIACEKTGRHARLIELDARYCDVICRRWQEFTGDAATLDGTERTFDDVAAGSREAAA